MVVTDGHVYKDGDRAVVAGQIENTTDRPCVAIVLAGFLEDVPVGARLK